MRAPGGLFGLRDLVNLEEVSQIGAGRFHSKLLRPRFYSPFFI
jgi:hypothetical protein